MLTEETPINEPLVLEPGEGRTTAFMGSTVRVTVPTDATGGMFCQFEYTGPAQYPGPVPHWHKNTEEHFFVLEGTPVFQVGDEVVPTRPGMSLLVPRRVPHKFSNLSEAPFRLLITMAPGGFEHYFAEIATIAAESPVWPPVDMAPLIALNALYDTHIILPGG